MKYYLVALFNKESYYFIKDIQKNLCRKYRLFKSNPIFHITLETVENPQIEKLNSIISDILSPYKKFKIEINDLVHFKGDNRSISLNVENKGYIIRLARNINETLKLHSFNVRNDSKNLCLHIPIANYNYFLEENNKKFIQLCDNISKENISGMIKIDRIELWKSINNRKNVTVQKFLLRDF